jgi:hypothetical protein
MKYTTIFSSTIKPLVSEERDKYLAMASLIDVGQFIPNIDTDKNIDLLPIAFNACVANRVNKNGDVIDTATALEICESFISKPINIEHNRERVVGTILTAGFSEFGTDQQISKEDIGERPGPFNITLGGVIWKIVNSDLAELIEDSGDPTNENYQKISASWELGFSDYHLVVLGEEEKNIENGEIISDPEKISKMQANLKALGGNGETEEGKFVYRKVVEQVVPLGIGLTESPAADVKGVAVIKEVEEEGVVKSSEADETEPKQADNTSLSDVDNVNIEKDVVMKITSLKDINDESLKTLEASAVHDFIQEEIRKESERFATEKAEKEQAIKESGEKLETISEDYNKVKEELDKVSTDLKTLEAEKAAKEADELFNQRMASFDEEYELSDEDRKVIASDIKELDENNFNSYNEKMTVLLRDKNKEVLAEQAKTEEAKTEEVKAEVVEEQAEASQEKEDAKEAVDEALDNAEVDSDAVAATTDAEAPSVYEKYKNAFSVENFNIS